MHRGADGDKLKLVPPLVLALIDSVFALALHHDKRAARSPLPNHSSASVRAELSAPTKGSVEGGLDGRVVVTLVPLGEAHAVSEESVSFVVDLEEERLLAMDLSLAELPLDRSGLARLIGELEAWCYARIPIAELVSAKIGTEEQLLGPGMVASVFIDVKDKLPVTWKSFTPSLGLELTFGHPLPDTVHMGVWGVLWAEVTRR